MVKHERKDRSPERSSPKGKSLKPRRKQSRERSNSPERKSRKQDSYHERRHSETHARSSDRHHSQHSRDRRSYERRKEGEGHLDLNRKIKEEPLSDDDRPKKFRNRQRKHDDKEYNWGKQAKEEEEEEKPVEKQKPNFGLSGKLTEEKNIFNGVVVKYSEPPEARIPKRRWRFYVFKGDENLPTLYLHRQSAYLMGRERKVADIPIDHPSCSKQHAVLQFRMISYEKPDGTTSRTIRPYIIDLESANGTYVNNQKIEPKRYVELFEKDVLKFGFSTREYVLLHEESKTEAAMDDMGQ